MIKDNDTGVRSGAREIYRGWHCLMSSSYKTENGSRDFASMCSNLEESGAPPHISTAGYSHRTQILIGGKRKGISSQRTAMADANGYKISCN